MVAPWRAGIKSVARRSRGCVRGGPAGGRRAASGRPAGVSAARPATGRPRGRRLVPADRRAPTVDRPRVDGGEALVAGAGRPGGRPRRAGRAWPARPATAARPATTPWRARPAPHRARRSRRRRRPPTAASPGRRRTRGDADRAPHTMPRSPGRGAHQAPVVRAGDEVDGQARVGRAQDRRRAGERRRLHR